MIYNKINIHLCISIYNYVFYKVCIFYFILLVDINLLGYITVSYINMAAYQWSGQMYSYLGLDLREMN